LRRFSSELGRGGISTVLGSLNESERVWFAAPRNETEFPASSELSKEFAFQEAANFPTHSSETIFWSDAVTILLANMTGHFSGRHVMRCKHMLVANKRSAGNGDDGWQFVFF